jgi:hypothetical protein
MKQRFAEEWAAGRMLTPARAGTATLIAATTAGVARRVGVRRLMFFASLDRFSSRAGRD